jgi:hypothetical protein
MHKRAVKYLYKGIEVWLDPSSNAYELHKNKQLDDLNKHLDLLIKQEK